MRLIYSLGFVDYVLFSVNPLTYLFVFLISLEALVNLIDPLFVTISPFVIPQAIEIEPRLLPFYATFGHSSYK